ncbi:hypothetical protein DJ71_13400, partial [Halorubrum sp. E3]
AAVKRALSALASRTDTATRPSVAVIDEAEAAQGDPRGLGLVDHGDGRSGRGVGATGQRGERPLDGGGRDHGRAGSPSLISGGSGVCRMESVYAAGSGPRRSGRSRSATPTGCTAASGRRRRRTGSRRLPPPPAARARI